jgi:hypothetical protein
MDDERQIVACEGKVIIGSQEGCPRGGRGDRRILPVIEHKVIGYRP